MAPYHHHVNLHHRLKRASRLKRFSKLVLAMFLIIVMVIGVDWVITNIRASKTVISKGSTASVQSSTINIFRTPYFQFQADRDWTESTEASTDTKFVYRSMDGPLVEHQLTVYVNEKPPAKLAATRVYTVELINGNFKQISNADQHCNSNDTGLKNEPKIVTFNQVTFKCDMGSNVFRAFVGLIGGTNEITALRPNGQTATYAIVYDDLTFIPSTSQISSIMDTFQIR